MKVSGGSFTVDDNAIKAADASNKADEVKVFSEEFQKKLNQTLFDKPTVFYNTKPTNPSVGDIYWDTSNGLTSGSATRFDGAHWQSVQSVSNLFGTNIYGVTVDGAVITGGVFKSASYHNGHADFFVDTQGQIFGANISANIGTASDLAFDDGHNPKKFSGEWSQDSSDRLGFNLDHGMMHFNAWVYPQESGSNYFGETYIEPDAIKLRHREQGYSAGTDEASGAAQYGGIRYRTDITASRIQTGTDWNDNNGAMLFADGRVIGDKGQFSSSGTFSNVFAGTVNGHATVGSTGGTDLYIHDRSDNTLGIHAGDIISHGKVLKDSQLSVKRDIESVPPQKALAMVMGTDIYSWKYKDADNSRVNYGPIIDDLNSDKEKQYNLPIDLIEDYGTGLAFDESNATAFLIGAVQELANRNSEQSVRIAKLEAEHGN